MAARSSSLSSANSGTSRMRDGSTAIGLILPRRERRPHRKCTPTPNRPVFTTNSPDRSLRVACEPEATGVNETCSSALADAGSRAKFGDAEGIALVVGAVRRAERAHLERLPCDAAELADPGASRFDVGDPEVAGD